MSDAEKFDPRRAEAEKQSHCSDCVLGCDVGCVHCGVGDGMRIDRIVLEFIHRFTKRHDKTLSDVERCFTDGCCWWFAHILCERFNGEMVYDEIDGHFGCEISGRVYDITGDVTETFRKTYWSVFVEREPNLSVRILRRCRDFEEV